MMSILRINHATATTNGQVHRKNTESDDFRKKVVFLIPGRTFFPCHLGGFLDSISFFQAISKNSKRSHEISKNRNAILEAALKILGRLQSASGRSGGGPGGGGSPLKIRVGGQSAPLERT